MRYHGVSGTPLPNQTTDRSQSIMWDSITTEEELHVGTIGSSAIASIQKQQTSIASIPIATPTSIISATAEYESIGSYGDEPVITQKVEQKAMTLAETLESGEYESLEEWIPSSNTNTLIPASLIVSAPVPEHIIALRCRYEKESEAHRLKKEAKKREKEAKKQRKRAEKEEKEREKKRLIESMPIKDLSDLTAIPDDAPIPVKAYQLPPLVPMQRSVKADDKSKTFLTSTFRSTLMGDAPLTSHQLPPLIPIQKKPMTSSFDAPLPVLVPLKTKSYSTSLRSSAPFQSSALPVLVPLQKKPSDVNISSIGAPVSRDSLPPLIPLRSKKVSIDSMKDMVGASFFGATSATPFGQSLGALNKFDIGCGYHGDVAKCPRSYIEKKMAYLSNQWLTYNTMPVISDNNPLIFLVPSESAVDNSIAVLNGDEGRIRTYLKSHMVRVTRAELMNQRNTTSYETEAPMERVFIGKTDDGRFFIDMMNRGPRIMISATGHSQVMVMENDEDFMPYGDSDSMMTMDGLIGNIKKKVLTKAGVKSAPLIRKYEDMVYNRASNSADVLESYSALDPDGEVKVKIETYRQVNRTDFTFKDSKPMTECEQKVKVVQNGSLKSPPNAYTFIIMMEGCGVNLAQLYDKGVSILLTNTISSVRVKKSGTSDSGFNDVRIPVKLKNKPLLFAFDKSSLERLKSEVGDGSQDYIVFMTTTTRGDQQGTYSLVFRRSGPCNGISFDPSTAWCGYSLYHITMNFTKAQLYQGLDYNTSFFATALPESESFDASAKSQLKKKESAHYSRLVFMPDVNEDDMRSDGASIDVTLSSYAKVDTVKHKLKKLQSSIILKSRITHTMSDKKHIYVISLDGQYTKLSDIIDKGMSLTLHGDSASLSQSFPTMLDKKELRFAFANDMEALKDYIKESAEKVKRDRSLSSIRQTVTFRAQGSEMPNGRGIYHVVFKVAGCNVANSSVTLGACDYVLSHVKMIFTDNEMRMGSVNYNAPVITTNPFEECLYHESLVRSVDLSETLTKIAKESNQFSDFQSMNGALKLVNALSDRVKSSITEMGESIEQTKQLTLKGRSYETSSLHSTLYEMNRTHLPLRKNEINEKADHIFASLNTRIGLEKMSHNEKLRVLSNLSHTIDTFSQIINSIVV